MSNPRNQPPSIFHTAVGRPILIPATAWGIEGRRQAMLSVSTAAQSKPQRVVVVPGVPGVPAVSGAAVGAGGRGIVARKVMIDTKKIERRKVRFRSIADMEREVDRLVSADRAGRIKLRGNWTMAQMLNHLAMWTDFFYIGFPIPRAPLLVRLMVKVLKGRILNGSMPQGIRLPNVRDGTLGAEPIALDDALAKFHGAIGRLKVGDAPRHPSPAFGPMTLDEVTRLTLRHAELHLGFADA